MTIGNGLSDSGRLEGKRILIVEEALRSRSGHWYEYVKAVVAQCRDTGAEAFVVCHANADPDILRELNGFAEFPWTSWDNIYRFPQAWKRYIGVAIHNIRLFGVMNRFVRRHGPFDLVFAPTVAIHHVIGWRLLVGFNSARRIGRLVLLFRNNAGSYPPGSKAPVFAKSAMIFKWALRSYAGLIRKGRARFTTDSERLATEYQLLCGLRPEVLPSPRAASAPARRAVARAANQPVVFSCLGPARFEKGIDVMQAAILAYLADHPDARVEFVIQWNDEILDEHGAVYHPDPRLLADPRVVLIREQMTSEEYDAAVMRTDCMLLPYRRESYFARISGVAVEAVTAGTPVIYTEDTWCEDLVKDMGAGVGAADGDVTGVRNAIEAVAADFPVYKAQAEARTSAAREHHSASAFLGALGAKPDLAPCSR